ncbi:hypothetical protein [Mycobacterium sp. 3519A]|uniref:hypothetical protein n=1 Tax=Mycobacterium sp. 3519A TaxID=2057184 RepID=UPI00190EA2C0|nr:hypothetical protein [Mycobacterium sp. 3519A]
MTVLMADCSGLWRRTLLIDRDGARDTSVGVAWLQGITAYVDTRGFAGRLSQRDDVFEWQRLIDIEPPGPFPDAGRMRWDNSILIEEGVHEPYVEHWVRQDGETAPSWAVFATDAILVCAGDTFGWADHRGVVLGVVGDSGWAAMDPRISDGELVANGVRRHIENSEGDVKL